MTNFKFQISNWFNKFKSSLLTLAGSFIIAAGWSWYHISKHNHLRFVLIALGVMIGAALGYRIFLALYDKFFPRWRRHPFWHTEFRAELDQLFFLSSLWFGVFFISLEIWSLAYVLCVLAILYFALRRALARHPEARQWLALHRALGIFALVIFCTQAVFQYLSYRWYILDSNVRFYNIVLFRSWAMTAFWLLGFAVAGLLSARLIGQRRHAALVVWSLVFFATLFLWSVNLSALYYSGLYFDPTAWEHLRHSEGLLTSRSLFVPTAGFITLTAGFFLALWQLARTHKKVPKFASQAYYGALAAVAILSLLAFGSLRNTPEHSVIVSFYDYYFGDNQQATIDPRILVKLKKFGLNYNPDAFFIAERPRVFSTSSPANLLPSKFNTAKPNIMIVFWESGSARLTSVYDNRFPGLTPGLAKMAGDKNTTIFENYFNASTPTITGTLSQLCSFLPPTGHEEIQTEKKIQRHRLLCLPEALHKNGYKYSAYITAVDKNYANKDGIYASMGTQDIYGTDELKSVISGEPLSWGYSDHQMLPFFFTHAEDSAQPFLMMLSTVDTHPPFNISKDVVPYGDGTNDLLNSFHTTDDAFSGFWDAFRQSSLADNTILIVVADHAVFPGAYDRKTFPAEAGKLNFYDQNLFLMYIPDSKLPKTVDTYASGLDITPTLLHLLGFSEPNSFEGHSIFDDRKNFPNLLGMHELGLYINQVDKQGKRKIDYNVPSHIECAPNHSPSSTPDLTLCDYLQFYHWKRAMFEEGRFWKR